MTKLPVLILDGPDGAGKSTLAKHVVGMLKADGYNPLLAVEPGTTRFGMEVRRLTQLFECAPKDGLPPTYKHVDPVAMAHLYRAATLQLWRESVEPAIAAKRVVVMDRCSFISAPIYQGVDLTTDADRELLEQCLVCIVTAPLETLKERRPNDDPERLEYLLNEYAFHAHDKFIPLTDPSVLNRPPEELWEVVYDDFLDHLDACGFSATPGAS